MYKLDLPVDYKEAAAIERRRQMEEERKTRIFNAKTRQIGVDMQALDQQVFDKNQAEEYERRRHEAFAADACRNDMIAEMLQKRQEEDIRALARAENEFRMLHQQPSSRREWDLYDPDAKKKDKPARVHDDDPRCGISSMQKFFGEDLNSKARRQFQQEQQRELDERAMQLAEAERQCRRAIEMATKDFNNAQDRERKEKERLKQQQDQDDNLTEIANHIYGDILTENPSVAQSAWGPHRVITDRWKGMTPQQLEAIRKEQEKQMLENERRRQEEKLRDAEWERQTNANARAALLLEREMDRKRRELNKQQADENRRLGQEQFAHKEFLDKEVYTNPPTAAYFMQFNTTTR
ncbi:hypothetical protein BaRGS_00018746 [Batillaria attramentaria]|uniref:RIB43A-like with coiled-coils protein 2 n=1 Tax=Batillaria attramentaria TaxID=370345 RepID=A0ABD0KS03_9CAEN